MITVYPMLAAHLWQSTLFAVAIGLLTLLLRKNPARTRFWVWLAALMKFLVPFGVLVSLGGHMSMAGWGPKPSLKAQPVISFVMGDMSEAAPPALKDAFAPLEDRHNHWPTILFGVWACGFVAVTFRWLQRWIRVRADVQAARPLPIEIGIPVVSSPVQREPGVFGVFRPVLILPDGMAEQLSKAEWEAILAHELCHARCYDNLTAAIYMLVETIFWFHPLVWWMGKRLVAERELACDEEVLRLGSEPRVYAEGILKICELYLESPLECVAGVAGSNLRRRVRSIMTYRGTKTLDIGKKLLLATAGLVAMAAPIVIGVLNARPSLAQSDEGERTAKPNFEVASIRPCDPDHVGGGGVGNGSMGVSPGALHVKCVSLMGLIRFSYVRLGDASFKTIFGRDPISGGPAWIKSGEYDIEAKAVGTPSGQMMEGPMLQGLLEDRFKLKIHREIREIPVYELAAGKSGFKLQPLPEGSCISPASLAKQCGRFGAAANNSPELTSVDLWGMSLDQMCEWLSRRTDRPIINKTGITGQFTIHLEFANDHVPSSTAADAPAGPLPDSFAAGPSIFTAVQEQLGLKLQPAKGPGTFLVVDSAERPAEN